MTSPRSTVVVASGSHAFYPRWILANGWSELLGLGGTFALGYLGASRLMAATSVAAIIAGAAAAVVMGTFLEGVLVGYAQGRVLQGELPAMPLRRWVAATALGAGIAWLLGMLPSTIVSLLGAGASPGAPPPEIEGLAQHALAAALGAVLGAFLGAPQAWVLGSHVARPARWIVANIVAWAVGMPLVFQGMDWIGPGAAAGRFISGVAVTCLAAGVIVGAIHGQWMRAMLRESAGVRTGSDSASVGPA
ncbi:MAG TPA: hypothetical protein VK886_10760 [Vicinamibacterales bacterium]|nr:hypothetical protein [Vicinamibacterales bacterium]